MLSSINPATGETLRSYPTLSDSELDERLARAAAAFEHHRRTRMPDRAQA
jgi:succinate-semialdehyde dehydrogenase/glutarate-semialdehyde dehydrogenase